VGSHPCDAVAHERSALEVSRGLLVEDLDPRLEVARHEDLAASDRNLVRPATDPVELLADHHGRSRSRYRGIRFFLRGGSRCGAVIRLVERER
jgi:hypothetical protein